MANIRKFHVAWTYNSTKMIIECIVKNNCLQMFPFWKFLAALHVNFTNQEVVKNFTTIRTVLKWKWKCTKHVKKCFYHYFNCFFPFWPLHLSFLSSLPNILSHAPSSVVHLECYSDYSDCTQIQPCLCHWITLQMVALLVGSVQIKKWCKQTHVQVIKCQKQ